MPRRRIESVVSAKNSIIALALFSFLSSGPSSAARLQPTNQIPCTLVLKGLIEPGDAARLAKALDDTQGPHNVCLDSPGGSLAEGEKIIEVILDNIGTGTVVHQGAECQAICAYIFMAGRRDFYHGTLVPNRSLHVGGKLGFQIAPASIVGSTASKDTVENTYRDGVRTVGALMRQNARAGGGKRYRDQLLPFPSALVVDALKTEPGEVLHVDTVEKAGRYGIELFGHKLPPLTAGDLRRACVFYSRWDGPIYSSPLGYSDMGPTMHSSGTIDLKHGELKRIALTQFGPKADQHCVVDLWQSRNSGLFIYYSFDSGPQSKDRKRPNHFQEDAINSIKNKEERAPEIRHPTWYVFPPNTRIADIKIH